MLCNNIDHVFDVRPHAHDPRVILCLEHYNLLRRILLLASESLFVFSINCLFHLLKPLHTLCCLIFLLLNKKLLGFCEEVVLPHGIFVEGWGGVWVFKHTVIVNGTQMNGILSELELGFLEPLNISKRGGQILFNPVEGS